MVCLEDGEVLVAGVTNNISLWIDDVELVPCDLMSCLRTLLIEGDELSDKEVSAEVVKSEDIGVVGGFVLVDWFSSL